MIPLISPQKHVILWLIKPPNYIISPKTPKDIALLYPDPQIKVLEEVSGDDLLTNVSYKFKPKDFKIMLSTLD